MEQILATQNCYKYAFWVSHMWHGNIFVLLLFIYFLSKIYSQTEQKRKINITNNIETEELNISVLAVSILKVIIGHYGLAQNNMD